MYKDYNEKKLMQDFVEESYLDYAMYVILDRALPSIIDGLKPVQRRIIYAMSELHLNYLAKHKKSARTVGDVLGKFHPHGESACYDAMVLMAQPFASRYPLIEGQGNFGTADDPKSFAAMRYTEAKLSKYAEILLEELDQGAVAWTNNFDGTLKEPKFLPAKLPMVLLNGTTGIAVGMATDILPHNLKEVADACVYILNHKDPSKIKVEDLCKYIIGPDFPTNAEIITTPQQLLEVYKTGNGSVKARATYIKENNTIVITALPYMVSGAKVLKQIADQIHSKNLQQLADLRDESDHANPTRLVLVPKSNRVDLDALMLHLFATTDLEKSYRVNFNMIGSNGLPKVKNLVEILQEWIAFRLNLVIEKLTQRLKELNVRLEVLQGLLIVYLNIDAVIKIIRHEDDPKATLIKKFKLTELQVEAILDLKLRNLAKLQEIKIKDEIAKVTADLQRINQILGSQALLKDLVKTEIKELSNKLKDPRRSPVVIREEAKTFSLNVSSKSTDNEITVIISEKGWVRCGKGHEIDLASLSYKAGDSYKSHAYGFYNQTVVFIDAVGKSYALSAASLPSMRGYGEPLTSKLAPDSGVGFVGVIIGNANDRVLFVQDKGFGFISEFNNLNARTKSGKSIINLGESKLLSPIKLTELAKYCVLISDNLKMLVINVDQIVTLSKGRGAKLIKLSSKHRVLASGVLAPKADLIISYNKHEFVIKHKDLLGYVGNIGDLGMDLPKLPKWQKNIKDLFIKSS